MQRLAHTVGVLGEALSSPPAFGRPWRYIVSRRLEAVIDALGDERVAPGDTWLDARAAHLHRERDRLLTQLQILARMVPEAGEVEPIRLRLLRVVRDLEHHGQRLNDLAYDVVAMEVGGSE